MTVGQICQRDVDLADLQETAFMAAQRMSARNVGTLVVLDSARRPVGIVTDRDLVVRVLGQGANPHATRVAEVMSAQPETVAEDCSIEDALAAMRAQGVRRLPVVGLTGQLTGVVSLDDILALISEELGLAGGILERSSPRRLAST